MLASCQQQWNSRVKSHTPGNAVPPLLPTTAAGSQGAAGAAVSDLIGRQAEWSEESANYEAAAEMYIKVGAMGGGGRGGGEGARGEGSPVEGQGDGGQEGMKRGKQG
jgi:hypothetical protein